MEKKKEKINKQIAFLRNRIEALKGKVTNAVSDEARAEIEARINQLREIAEDLEAIRDEAEQGNNDNSEEMLTRMRELLSRVETLENELNKPDVKKAENRMTGSKFMEVVRNSVNRAQFRENIKNAIGDNGIQNVQEFLPAAVLQEVSDCLSNRHRLLELVDWTGLPCFLAKINTSDDGANVYNGGAKTEQNPEFTDIELRPKYIYKFLRVAKEIERETRDNGNKLLQYVTRELLDNVLLKTEQLILHGQTTQFIAPAAVPYRTDANGNPRYHAMNYLPYIDRNRLIAIVSPSLYIRVKEDVQSSYGYMVSDEFIANSVFGVREVVIMPEGTTPNGIGLWFMDYGAYKLVGDRRPDEYEDFNLEYNQKEYLTEMWIGGGCVRSTKDPVGEPIMRFIEIIQGL